MEPVPDERSLLESILNAITHGIVLIDSRYRIQYANPAIVGLHDGSGHFVGTLCYEVLEKRESICPDCPTIETFRTGRVAHVTRKYVRKDGGLRVLKVSSYPIHDRDKVVQCVLSSRDITEIHYLEKQKEDLLKMLTHDIRNPVLATAQSLNNILQGNYGDVSSPQKSVLGVSRDTCELLLAMIDDLLDIYRHEVGQFRISRSRVDMNQVISTALGLVEILAKERNISFEVRKDRDIPPLMGDNQRLIRCLINLLENAIKYSPTGEKVLIEAGERGCLVQVIVTNRGNPIPPENLERIFEKYFRAERSHFGGKTGMGLGLTFCRQTIEAHEGKIWAESPLKGVDYGSRFVFTLPMEGRR